MPGRLILMIMMMLMIIGRIIKIFVTAENKLEEENLCGIIMETE